MSYRTSLAIVALVAALASPAAASTSGVTERVRVGVPGLSLRKQFAQSLTVRLRAPSGYRRLTADTWVGPPALNDQNAGDPTSIRWGFAVVAERNVHGAALARLIQGYPLVQGARILVPHLISGRLVGQIAGEFLVSQRDARAEGAVAFPLGRGLVAVVSFAALSPAFDDAAPYGKYTVHGSTLASSWNRAKVTNAITKVALDGSLPPARVTATPTAAPTPAGGDTVVVGNVLDLFGHPVAGARVRLNRGPTTVAMGVVDPDGRYRLVIPDYHATYHVVASFPRAASFDPPATASSPPFEAG